MPSKAGSEFKPGDVIQDAHGSPAVVLKIDESGKPERIMQTVGRDAGRIAAAPGRLVRVENPNVINWAREFARAASGRPPSGGEKVFAQKPFLLRQTER